MRAILPLLLAIVLASSPAFGDDDYDCGLTSSASNRVVSGKQAKDGEFPFLAAIVYERKGHGSPALCTGNIISRHHILTAGHCTVPGATTTVYYGGANRRNETGVVVKNILKHEGFHGAGFSAPDIGVLELENPIDFNDVTGRVCLPKVYKEEVGAQATVIGFGTDDTVEQYKQTRAIAEWNTVAFYDAAMCEDAFQTSKGDAANNTVFICAGGYNTGTEKGDSGGPLVSNVKGRNFLVGLTSLGKTVNDPDGAYDLGLYTRITFFCEWIERTTKGEAKCLDAEKQPPVAKA